MSTSTNTSAPPDQVDVRGPRFAAWVTTAVLVATLLVSAVSPVSSSSPVQIVSMRTPLF